jgi:hypothetical protein
MFDVSAFTLIPRWQARMRLQGRTQAVICAADEVLQPSAAAERFNIRMTAWVPMKYKEVI